MTFDQYKNDQVMQMFLTEENKNRSYGFKISDRPDRHMKETIKLMESFQETDNETEKERIMAELNENSHIRMRTGKFFNGDVGIFINDKNGKVRVRVYVGADDAPHLEILDADGNVSAKLV